MEQVLLIIEIVQKSVTILGILTAGFFGYIAISKSLKQDYISKKLVENNEKNQILQKQVLEFISKWNNSKNNFPIIDREEWREIYKDYLSIANKAISCETKIANVATVTKWFMENINYILDYKEGKINSNALNIIMQSCDKILLFTSKQVVFPSIFSLAFFVKKEYIYSYKLKPFVNNWKIKTMRFMNQGVNIQPFNAEIIFICEVVNNMYNSIYSLSFLRSLRSYIPITILLYLEGIYFPPIIKTKRFDAMINDYWHLMLSGFHKNINLGTEVIESYEFWFTTDRSGYGIVKESIEGFDIKNSTDGFLLYNAQGLPKINNIQFKKPDTICITVNIETLVQYSNGKIKKLKKKIKEEYKKNKGRPT